MALKRRIKRLTKTEALRVTGRRYLTCGECNNDTPTKTAAKKKVIKKVTKKKNIKKKDK